MFHVNFLLFHEQAKESRVLVCSGNLHKVASKIACNTRLDGCIYLTTEMAVEARLAVDVKRYY